MKLQKDIGRVLMDIAVFSRALNKIPTIELPTVLRMQGVYGVAEMEAMAKNHEVQQLNGFINTAYETLP